MIALWHEGSLGDLLLSRLAIAALTERGPAVLLARSEVRKVYVSTGLVAQSFSAETPPSGLRPKKVYFFARSEAPRDYLQRIFPKAFLQRLPTLPEEPRHVALFQLAMAGGCLKRAGRALRLAPRDFRREPRFLLVHPGSGGRRKCYPPERLLQALQGFSVLPVRVILGPAEEDLAPLFREFPVCQSRTLAQALQALSQAQAYLGNDSGLTHLAAALGVPVLALFGPTDPRLWAPFGGPVRVLYPFEHLTPQRLTLELKKFINTIPRWAAPRPKACGQPEVEPWEADSSDSEGPWGADTLSPEKRPKVEAKGPRPGPPRRFAELHLLGVEVVAVEEGEPR
ncbi:MAG: hypothetical protein DSZ24_04980 [Thermodesulfatator sp.]|nr:MAG: hypothetical protein DSZ24_04980 [Thermodesulfatator sp.]